MKLKTFVTLFATSSLCQTLWAADQCVAPTVELPSNQWKQISIPCTPPAFPNNTAAGFDRTSGIFGDDIPGVFGVDWTVFYYDAVENTYKQLKLEDGTYLTPIEQGKGYWIIQNTGSSVTLDMPAGSTDTVTEKSANCVAPSGVKCFDVSLETTSVANPGVKWNLVGTPFDGTVDGDPGTAYNNQLQDMLVLHGSDGSLSTCSNSLLGGCSLDDPLNKVVYPTLFRYNGGATPPVYEQLTVEKESNLNPWDGFWAATLDASSGLSPKLRFKFSAGGVGS